MSNISTKREIAIIRNVREKIILHYRGGKNHFKIAGMMKECEKRLKKMGICFEKH